MKEKDRWPMYARYLVFCDENVLRSHQETLQKHLEEHQRRFEETRDKLTLVIEQLHSRKV